MGTGELECLVEFSNASFLFGLILGLVFSVLKSIYFSDKWPESPDGAEAALCCEKC